MGNRSRNISHLIPEDSAFEIDLSEACSGALVGQTSSWLMEFVS